LALWLIWRIWSVVVLLLISTVFAAGLAPAVARLEKLRLVRGRPLPRSAAIFLIYIAAIIIVLAAAALVIVPVVHEALRFSHNLPGYLDKVRAWLEQLQTRYPQMPNYAEMLDKARDQLGAAGKYIVATAPAVFGFFGSVLSLVTVLVLTFYLLLTYEAIRKSFLSIVPARHAELAGRTISLMAAAMGGWLRGQLLLAAIVGLTTAFTMGVVFRVPYPFVIAIVGAVGELVPMVGVLAAAITAILITAFGPLWKLIGSVVFFIFLSFLEGNVLSPRIMQRTVGVSPLVTIVALLAGAALLGVVGALLAIPLAAALQVLLREVVVPAINREPDPSGQQSHPPG